jgi:uncharacterized membrane protein
MSFNPQPGSAGVIEPDPAPAPSANEFTIAWIAYGCFYAGVLLWWPSLIGLIIGYLRRGEPGAGFIRSHYGWLIRTFWWSTLAWIASIAVIVSGAAPLLRDLFRSARSGEGGRWEIERLVTIEWGSIFAAAGLASVGGLALLGVYVYLVYRLVRGSLRLAAGKAAP